MLLTISFGTVIDIWSRICKRSYPKRFDYHHFPKQFEISWLPYIQVCFQFIYLKVEIHFIISFLVIIFFLVFERLHAGKLCDKTWRAFSLQFVRWPGEAGVRPRRAFVCAAKYSAADVKLDRLRVNPTRQHPAFVIISAHAQLLLLICSRLPLTIRNPPFSALSVLPLSAALKRSQVILFCLFDMPFVLKLFSSLFCSSTL